MAHGSEIRGLPSRQPVSQCDAGAIVIMNHVFSDLSHANPTPCWCRLPGTRIVAPHHRSPERTLIDSQSSWFNQARRRKQVARFPHRGLIQDRPRCGNPPGYSDNTMERRGAHQEGKTERIWAGRIKSWAQRGPKRVQRSTDWRRLCTAERIARVTSTYCLEVSTCDRRILQAEVDAMRWE